MARKLKNIELNRFSFEEFKDAPKKRVSVLLDNIRSMLNIGSVFRTSDAFAIEHIYLCGITAKPPHREITKTAIGAEKSVDWTYAESVSECIKSLKSRGHWIIGVEQMDNSIMLDQYTPPNDQPIVLIFGNEVSGLSDETVELCDEFIEIPQYGTKHSLNISVSAGVALWEIQKQLS